MIFRQCLLRLKRPISRSFGSHGHPGERAQIDSVVYNPVHKYIGQGLLLTTFLWIMFMFKEDRGKLFGFYKPWLEGHAHSHHLHYESSGRVGEAMPVVHSDDQHEDEDEE